MGWKSPHLADQAQGPVGGRALKMAAPPALVEEINSIPEYVAEFKKVYGNDIKSRFEKMTSTISVFEKTLVSVTI